MSAASIVSDAIVRPSHRSDLGARINEAAVYAAENSVLQPGTANNDMLQ